MSDSGAYSNRVRPNGHDHAAQQSGRQSDSLGGSPGAEASKAPRADHKNYGSYVATESNALFGRPQQNANVAYQPRMLQLGFRIAF